VQRVANNLFQSVALQGGTVAAKETPEPMRQAG